MGVNGNLGLSCVSAVKKRLPNHTSESRSQPQIKMPVFWISGLIESWDETIRSAVV